MKIKSAAKSHVGLKRKVNEDEILVAPELGLYLLADGMGGHRAGGEASRMAVDAMVEYWRKIESGIFPDFLGPVDEEIPLRARHLINSVYFANTLICEAQKKPARQGMGSTIAALLVDGNQIWAANVGDSRIYLSDQGRLMQISEDHSLVEEQKSLGLMNAFDPNSPVIKGILTRALGLQEHVEVFAHPIRPEAGDLMLMCSDGLTNFTEEDFIRTVLDDFSMSLERKVAVLIEEALKGGGGDNVSVVLLEFYEEGKWDRFKRRLGTRL